MDIELHLLNLKIWLLILFVDIEGLEMSRGTVIQAEAAYEIPRAFMNPILLKPNSDNNSQVIINGKVAYTVDAKTYFSNYKRFKKNSFRFL